MTSSLGHLAPLLLTLAAGQFAGTVIPEEAPSMVMESCTLAGGCTPETVSLVIDSNWRWVHNIGGYQNCFSSEGWNDEFCPDPDTCKQNCAVEGVDAKGYKKNYGVHQMFDKDDDDAEGDSEDTKDEKGDPIGVKLDFSTAGGNVGSRLYIKDTEHSYKMFKLLNREFTLDVKMKKLGCGTNGAVYFIEMDPFGGMGRDGNAAGAKFGTGYCDAQCPYEKFETNASLGICCVEMDIWEANRRATAYTPHPCSTIGPVRCAGNVECGYGENGERWQGLCDKDGCDLNTYRMGAHSFYGPGKDFEVDSMKPLTVVTQFLTDDGTDTGKLVEIRRLYVQDGKLIQNAESSIPNVTGNAITDSFCNEQKKAFEDYDHHQEKGGLASMGEALARGLVLSVSVWDDFSTHMAWLDAQFPPEEDPAERLGVIRGPCNASDDGPVEVRPKHTKAWVKYFNFRYGEIGSTYQDKVARRLESAEPVESVLV